MPVITDAMIGGIAWNEHYKYIKLDDNTQLAFATAFKTYLVLAREDRRFVQNEV